MKPKHAILAVVGITAVAVALLLIRNGTTISPGQRDAVRIGVLLPLTGNTAFLGEMCKNALDLSAMDINNRGGINGRTLILEYGDNKNDTKEGIALFNRMKMQDINVIISSMSGITASLKPLLTDDNTLVFATMVSTRGITDGTPYLFRLFVNADTDARTMAEYAAGTLGLKRIAIIAVNDEMGQSFSDVFAKTFISNHGIIVANESFDKGMKDFRDLVQRLKDQKCDAFYLLGYDANLGMLATQIREAGFTQPLLSIGTLAQENVRKSAGSAVDDAFYTSVVYDPAKPAAGTQAAPFVDAYTKKFGKSPTYFSAFSYDTIQLISLAMRKNGVSPKGVQSALTAMEYDGVIGHISFNGTRDAAFPMEVRRLPKAETK